MVDVESPHDQLGDLSVTAHILLNDAAAICDMAGALRRHGHRLGPGQAATMLESIERQAHHLGQVMHRLAQGLTTEALALAATGGRPRVRTELGSGVVP